MLNIFFLLTSIFSVSEASNLRTNNLYIKNLHTREFYEEKFVNWMSLFNITCKDGPIFRNMLNNFANNDDIIESHNENMLLNKSPI